MDNNRIESSTFQYYFPEVMRENPDYKVLIDLASLTFGRLESEIDDFTSLIDPDTCPVAFLPLLGSLLGYNYRYDIKPEFNREIIKNILSIYAMRGTDRALILAATYGDCPGYIGGEIFIPGTKPERVEAYLLYPRDQIFRHTKSTYSGPDKRADGQYIREGIIEVVVERYNTQLRDRAESVKPAGYVLKFRHVVYPESVTGTNEIIPDFSVSLSIMFKVNSTVYVPSSAWSIGSARSADFKYCGERFNIVDVLRMYDLSWTDGRRYYITKDNPVWLYYQPDESLFDQPAELQLPAESKLSGTDHCVTSCKVIYGFTENSSYDEEADHHTIEDFSEKYVVTGVDVVTSFWDPDNPDPPVDPNPDPDEPDQPIDPPIEPDPNPPVDPDQPDQPIEPPVDPDEPTNPETNKSYTYSEGGARSQDLTYSGSDDSESNPDEPETSSGSHIYSEGGARSDDFTYGGDPDRT